MTPLDLIRSKDGSLSLTKLAAATAHLNMAVMFIWLTLTRGYMESLWVFYGTIAIMHAVVDKSAAQIKAFKDTKLEKEPDQS